MTLEGVLTYPQGYMLVKGVKGEFYAVSEPKFLKKYEHLKGTTDQVKAGNVIDATEYTGTNINRVLKFCPFAQVDNQGILYVQASWENLACKVGDYVIRYNPDDYGVCDAKVFKETYERA